MLARESSGPFTGLPSAWKRGLPGPVEKGTRGLAGGRPGKKLELGFTRLEALQAKQRHHGTAPAGGPLGPGSGPAPFPLLTLGPVPEGGQRLRAAAWCCRQPAPGPCSQPGTGSLCGLPGHRQARDTVAPGQAQGGCQMQAWNRGGPALAVRSVGVKRVGGLLGVPAPAAQGKGSGMSLQPLPGTGATGHLQLALLGERRGQGQRGLEQRW